MAEKNSRRNQTMRDIYDVDKPTGPEHIFIMPIDRSGTQEIGRAHV